MNIKIATVLLSLACCSVNFANADIFAGLDHTIPGVIYYPFSPSSFTVSSSTEFCYAPSTPPGYPDCYPAENAFDGNTNGYHLDGSVFITDTSDPDLWWQVKFDSGAKVLTGVRIWNRISLCGAPPAPCLDRLDDFTLKLMLSCGDGPAKLQGTYTNTAGSGQEVYEVVFPDGGIVADEIKITVPNTGDFLQLAEVQVYIPDTSKTPTPKTCNKAKNPPPASSNKNKRKRRLVKTRE